MRIRVQCAKSILRVCAWSRHSALAIICILALFGAAMQGQTLAVLHAFTGRADGAHSFAGLIRDARGNLYGTTALGGLTGYCYQGLGCGTVIELERKSAGWIVVPIYAFHGGSDGAYLDGRVTLGPDGAIYGVTATGGLGTCVIYGNEGCGTVFRLTPPPTPCLTALCPWVETILYRFTGGNDGSDPLGTELTFDTAGNIYGTTYLGGTYGAGVVFELNHSSSGWTESVLYNFTHGHDGGLPVGGLILDSSGNLYGTAAGGGDYNNCGTVFELTRSGGSWYENTLYDFNPAIGDGCNPSGPLLIDSSGTIYGGTGSGGPLNGGTVFALKNIRGVWTDSVLRAFAGSNGAGVAAGLTMDEGGHLYGTTSLEGLYQSGFVFKLTPTGNDWNFLDLYDFTNGPDGARPVGKVLLDSDGNLFGTTAYGGSLACSGGCGTIWQITP